MAIQIQVRRGDASLWTSTNPVLAEGEIGAELDTGKFKIGDGTTAWNSLGYSSDLEIDTIIGNRTYTEQNYVTDNENVTDSIDALDTNLNLVQSGGLPGAFAAMPYVGTAPIVESGSNANGTYIKYADGTMICTKLKYLATLAVTGSSGITGLYSSAQVDIGPWPVSFIDTPISTENVTNSDASTCWLGMQVLQTPTNSKRVVVLIPASVTVNNVRIDSIAIGRWKA